MSSSYSAVAIQSEHKVLLHPELSQLCLLGSSACALPDQHWDDDHNRKWCFCRFHLFTLHNDALLHPLCTDIQGNLLNQAKNPERYHLIYYKSCLGSLLEVLFRFALSTFSGVNLMLPSKCTQPRWGREERSSFLCGHLAGGSDKCL